MHLCSALIFGRNFPVLPLKVWFQGEISAPIFEISGMVTAVAGVAGLWNVSNDRRTMETSLQRRFGVGTPSIFGPYYGHLRVRIIDYAQKTPGNRRPFQKTTGTGCPGLMVLVAIIADFKVKTTTLLAKKHSSENTYPERLEAEYARYHRWNESTQSHNHTTQSRNHTTQSRNHTTQSHNHTTHSQSHHTITQSHHAITQSHLTITPRNHTTQIRNHTTQS